MAVRPEEITAILKQQIEQFGAEASSVNVGTVIDAGDGIARVHGLSECMYSELVEFENGTMGLAMNLEEETVGVLVLGDYVDIQEGQQVKTTGRIAEVPVGDGMLGRVVDALGSPIDGKGPINTDKTRPIERIAPDVVTRKGVNVPLQTGIKAIDSMIPVGRGQRELIIGDRQTGKTASPSTPSSTRRAGDVVCIYVAIGQKASTVAQTCDARTRRRDGIHHRRQRPQLTLRRCKYLAPYAGCAMGEDFMDNGATRSSFMTTFRSRPWPIASFRCCCAVLQAARPTRATCSISTAAPGALRRKSERRIRRRLPDRLCRSSRPRRRRLGLHPDERHFDHRRPDLPRSRPLQRGHPSRHQRRSSRSRASAVRRNVERFARLREL